MRGLPKAWSAEGVDYSRVLHAADLVALLRVLKLEPAHLVGHSYGGAVAVLVAMEHPELVRSMALGEPSLFSVLQSSEDQSLLARHRQKLSEVQSFLQSGQDGRAVCEFLKVVVGADVFATLPELTRSVIMQNVRTLQPMLRTFFEPMVFDYQTARTVNVPTLLIKGELSPEISHRIASRLDSSFPNAELFTLAGASHGLQIEKPAEFNQTIQRFLAKHSR